MLVLPVYHVDDSLKDCKSQVGKQFRFFQMELTLCDFWTRSLSSSQNVQIDREKRLYPVAVYLYRDCQYRLVVQAARTNRYICTLEQIICDRLRAIQSVLVLVRR